MVPLSLNAELLRQASYLADDEFYLERAVKFLKSLVKEKKTREKDESLMTKEDYFARIDHSMQQATEGKVKTFSDVKEMNQWLETYNS